VRNRDSRDKRSVANAALVVDREPSFPIVCASKALEYRPKIANKGHFVIYCDLAPVSRVLVECQIANSEI